MIETTSALYILRRPSLIVLPLVLTLMLLVAGSPVVEAHSVAPDQVNRTSVVLQPTTSLPSAALPLVPATDTVTATVHLPLVARNYTTWITSVAPEEAWTADWWQWSERTNSAPIYQQGNVDCGLGQTGDVWFLAGTDGNGPVERTCVVPPDKTFLVPLQTVAWHNEGSENLTVPEKRAVLDSVFSDTEPGPYTSKICHLESSINGEPVNNVRLQSPTFHLVADPEAVADGYWFAFHVIRGTHTIKFRGALCDFNTGIPTNDINVTYMIEVGADDSAEGASWQLFVWNTNLNPYATGCSPQDPTGVVPCDGVSLGRNSVYAGSPPWSFTAPANGARLTVVDTGDSGDEFELFDNGVSIGMTSPAQASVYCYVPVGGDPGLCLRETGMSSGEFMLGAGDHSITIKPVKGFDFGVGYFRFEPIEAGARE